jgi:hypothetical protein
MFKFTSSACSNDSATRWGHVLAPSRQMWARLASEARARKREVLYGGRGGGGAVGERGSGERGSGGGGGGGGAGKLRNWSGGAHAEGMIGSALQH